MKILHHLIPLVAIAGAITASASEPIRLRLAPETEYISTREGTEVTLKITLEGIASMSDRRTPINLALVLDRSGSMRGAKLEKARQAASVVLERLGREDVFSLVIYDSEAKVLIPPRRVTDPKSMNRRIRSIEAGGSTALHAGVKLGADQLREFFDRENINRVILLSDGLANVGPKSPGALARLGRRLADDGIHVSTIGLGDDYNEDLMVALAEASAANYYYVKDAEKLPGIFEEELGHIRNILARNIEIVIELPEGVVGVEVLGHPEIRFRGNRATITLGELYGLQKRDFLVRCRVDEPGEEPLALAAVKLGYRDELAGVNQETTGSVTVRRSGDAGRIRSSRNEDVAERIAVTTNVIARDKALKLADEGKIEEAAATLRHQAAENAAAAPKFDNELLKQEADALERTADELESRGGFSRGDRKRFQYESYEQKKQK